MKIKQTLLLAFLIVSIFFVKIETASAQLGKIARSLTEAIKPSRGEFEFKRNIELPKPSFENYFKRLEEEKRIIEDIERKAFEKELIEERKKFKEINDRIDEINNKLSLGDKEFNTKQYSEAISFYEEAYSKAKLLDNNKQQFAKTPSSFFSPLFTKTTPLFYNHLMWKNQRLIRIANTKIVEALFKSGIQELDSKNFKLALDSFSEIIIRIEKEGILESIENNEFLSVNDQRRNMTEAAKALRSLAANLASEYAKRSKGEEYLTQALFYRGLCQYNTGDFVSAISDFNKAYSNFRTIDNLDKNSKDMLLNLLYMKGDAETKIGNLATIDTYNRILKIDPKQDRATFLKGMFHIQNGQIDQGLEALNIERIKGSDSSVPKHVRASAYYFLSLANFVKGDYEKANSYQNIAEIVLPHISDHRNFDLFVIYTNTGWQNYLKGDYEGCIRESSKAIELDPNNSTPRYNLGLVHLIEGRNTEAFINYEKAIAADKDLKVFDLAIQDLNEALKLQKIDKQNYHHGKHILYLNKGIIEAEIDGIEKSKEALTKAHEEKELFLSQFEVLFSFLDESGNPVPPTKYATGSLFSEFVNNPKAILNESWIPISTKEVRFIDSPKKLFKLCDGILEINGNIQLDEIRKRFENIAIIDEMTQIMSYLNAQDGVAASLTKQGLVFSYSSSKGKTLVADLSTSLEDIETMTRSYFQARDRISDRLTLKRLVEKLKKGQSLTGVDGAGFLEPSKFLDLIYEHVGAEVGRVIIKPDRFIGDINFRAIQAIQKLSNQKKQMISIRMDQPQLSRTLENVRKPSHVSMNQSAFLVTLPLDKESFYNSNFGKAQIEKGLTWEDYEKSELKKLKQTIDKLSKWFGHENVIINTTRQDFLNMLNKRHFLTLTLISEHNIAEAADYFEMKDGLWDVKQMAKDIENAKLPDGQILNFITCKGKSILPEMYLNRGTAMVSSSSGEVELGRALDTFLKAVSEMKKGKEFDKAYDEAEYKVLKDIIKGKGNFSPNLKGIPIEKSELDREEEMKEALAFAM